MEAKRSLFDGQTFMAVGYCFIVIPILSQTFIGKIILAILGIIFLARGYTLNKSI